MNPVYSHTPPPSPPPMPSIRGALLDVSDARSALIRADKAWRPAHLQECINTARAYLDAAERAMREGGAWSEAPKVGG